MTDHLNLLPHRVLREDRSDGTVLLRSGHALGPVARCTGDWLENWAAQTPDAVFLAEREGRGWRKLSYAAALRDVQAIASHLVTRELGPNRPILILSGNSIDHALITLAAQYVGIPTVPVAEQYSLIPAAHSRLDYVVRLVTPGMVYVSDAEAFAAALGRETLAGVEVVASKPTAQSTDFNSFLRSSGHDVAAAFSAVGPETLAKILMTSGSTSDPKGVLTTQSMMTTNQEQLAVSLPFLRDRPPQLVDWLPWNHVFGGSHNFNMVLANGGALFIDDGKPAPGLFDRTVENLGMEAGTISFNVPVGFAQLVVALKKNAVLRETYFRDLQMIFYAGASLPQSVWSDLETLALETTGRLPLITSSWGLTETAPGALLQHVPAKGAGIVGVPMPGLTVKLVPDRDANFDVRVRGDSITKGYLGAPDKTRDAFDDEGFFLTGDAMSLVDPDDPDKGLKFEGRMSEDFKLMTGTRVNASALRLAVLAELAPFASDLVLTGEGRESLAALIVPNRAAIAERGWEIQDQDGLLVCPELDAALRERLARHARKATGSASCVTAMLVMSDPPSMGEGEVTAKGNLNFARILQRRAELVERLYSPEDPARILA